MTVESRNYFLLSHVIVIFFFTKVTKGFGFGLHGGKKLFSLQPRVHVETLQTTQAIRSKYWCKTHLTDKQPATQQCRLSSKMLFKAKCDGAQA